MPLTWTPNDTRNACILDPNGDVELVLKDWSYSMGYEALKATATISFAQADSSNSGETLKIHPEMDVRMLASSKVLMRESRYFRKMFQGDWTERSALQANKSIKLTIFDWDPQALWIVLSILHGHARRAPIYMPINMLTKIAIIVDFYGCHDAMEPYMNGWLATSYPVANKLGANMVKLLLVTWVFQKHFSFNHYAGMAAAQSRRRISDYGLPIPKSIIGKCTFYHASSSKKIKLTFVDVIEYARIGAIQGALIAINSVINKLESQSVCGLACDSIVLGYLRKYLRAGKCFDPDFKAPYIGENFEDFVHWIQGMTLPEWKCNGLYLSRGVRNPECPASRVLSSVQRALKEHQFMISLSRVAPAV